MADIQNSTADTERQPGYVEVLIQFIKDSYAELGRVQWPNRETVISHTTIVVALVIFMACYVGAWDAFWTWAFSTPSTSAASKS